MLLFGNGSVERLIACRAVIVADALALFKTVFRAGDSFNGIPVVVGFMTERVGVIILARLVFMSAACINGVTLFGACGSNRFGRNISAILYFRFIAAAVTSASPYAVAAVHFRCFVLAADEIPVTELVAECLNCVGIHNSTAAQTHAARVTVLMACGRNDRGFAPVVTECGLLERIRRARLNFAV